MATAVRIAPLTIVQGPAIAPGLHGLVASSTSATEDDDRWEAGFEWQAENCVTAHTWSLDPSQIDGTYPNPTKSQAVIPSIGANQPIVLELATTCSSAGWRTNDFVGRVTRQMEACTSNALEAEFWTAAENPQNQHLASGTAVTQLGGGTAQNPNLALALLESALASCLCGARGMIHASAGLVSRWAYEGGALAIDGPRLVTTARGSIVVAGGGYPGTSPSGAAPSAGNEWAYATGMVQVRLGAIQVVPDSLEQALNHRTNMIEYRAERTVSAIFDPCCGPFAVQVNLAGT
jgi:hypothetical protein